MDWLTPEALKIGEWMVIVVVLVAGYKLLDRVVDIAEAWVKHQMEQNERILVSISEGFTKIITIVDGLHKEIKEWTELLAKKNGKT